MRKVVGKSEVQWEQANPDFVKQIEIYYFFEEVQNMRVEAYDCDDENKMQDLKAHDFIGAVEFSLASVISSRNQRREEMLKENRKGAPKLIIQGEKKAEGSSQTLKIQFEGNFNKSAVFYIIWKQLSGGESWKPVFKSEAQPNTSKATWREQHLQTVMLCDGEP